jgi:hypothetical protein
MSFFKKVMQAMRRRYDAVVLADASTVAGLASASSAVVLAEATTAAWLA